MNKERNTQKPTRNSASLDKRNEIFVKIPNGETAYLHAIENHLRLMIIPSRKHQKTIVEIDTDQ